MGVKAWPLGEPQPFGVKSDYSWHEIGALFRIIGEYRIQLFVETSVGRGDLTAWMLARSYFDPSFSYLGVTNDPNAVDQQIQDKITLQSFVAVGAACSSLMTRKVGALIRNSSCALVFCNGLDIDREVDHYLPLLRPGDVLVAHHYLTRYSGRKLMERARDGSLSRITGDWVVRTRLIAGVIT